MYRRKRRQKRKRRVVPQKRKKQIEDFLNCYDFAYAGRDVGNQAAKVAPGVIKSATNDIKNIAKQRTDQIISHGGKFLQEP